MKKLHVIRPKDWHRKLWVKEPHTIITYLWVYEIKVINIKHELFYGSLISASYAIMQSSSFASQSWHYYGYLRGKNLPGSGLTCLLLAKQCTWFGFAQLHFCSSFFSWIRLLLDSFFACLGWLTKACLVWLERIFAAACLERCNVIGFIFVRYDTSYIALPSFGTVNIACF